MKKHRVAVVGCGSLAQSAHLPNCAANPRIDLVATCDIVPEVAEDTRARFGAERAETDWRRVVEADDIDFCVLATHTELRGEFIIPALEAGKPVYTEKPLAPSREEMNKIVRVSRRTGKPVCVGHNRRSSPAILEFKRLLEKAEGMQGLLPSVDRADERARIPEEAGRQMLLRINDDIRSWKNWVMWDSEGIMFAEMVHFIDLALWLNRGKPVRVFAEGSARGNFVISIRYDDGSITTMQHSMVGHFDYPKELIEVSLNNITLVMEQHIEVRQCGMPDEPLVRAFPFAKGCDWAQGQGVGAYLRAVEAEQKAAVAENRPARFLDVNKGHYLQLDHFLDHMEGRGENPCSVESAVPVNSIALKVLESSRLGLPLAVTPADWHVPEVD